MGQLIGIIMIFALFLASCAEHKARMEAARQARQVALDTEDDSRCRNYGALPGSQSYVECRMLIATQRTNIEAAQEMQRQQIYTNMMTTGLAIAAGQ